MSLEVPPTKRKSSIVVSRARLWSGDSQPSSFFIFERSIQPFDLARDGGRPFYPIDLLGCVLKNAEEYRKLLRPWQTPPDTRKVWEVCQRQQQKWQAFRIWPQENRGIEDSFPCHVESFMQWAKAHMNAEGIAGVKEPSYLHEGWTYKQRRRQRFQVHHWLHDYERARRRRLARHGFDRSFKLSEDPKEQDELTTWIEYVNFGCWWLDRNTQHWQGLENREPL